MATHSSSSASQRYLALRVISSIYVFLAFLCGLAIFIFVTVGMSMGLIVPFVIIGVIGGIFGIITCLAAAEAIKVFLDIEENTRNTFRIVSRAEKK